MSAALEVAPYAAGITGAVLVCLGAGVLIAKVIGAGNGPDEACPEWVVEDPNGSEWPYAGPVWRPCPHRLPCPIHTPSRRRHGRQA